MKSILDNKSLNDFLKFGQWKQMQQDLNKWFNTACEKRITG